MASHLGRPVGRPPQSGIQVKIVDLPYQAKSWSRPRRVVAKIEWHQGELFPRIGLVITNSRLPAGKVIRVYNGRVEIENRIKEGKNTLRWDKTSCQRFEANQARLQMGVPAYNLLHMIRQFSVWGEEVKRSVGVADQAINQSGRQGFLSCPEMVCPCGLRLSSGTPLSGSAGLGSLRSTALRYPDSKGQLCQYFCEDYQVRLIG